LGEAATATKPELVPAPALRARGDRPLIRCMLYVGADAETILPRARRMNALAE
jgi:hypothetical protein